MAKKGLKILLLIYLVMASLSDLYSNKVKAESGVVIEDAWIRVSRGDVPVSAGYMRILNKTDKDVELVGVEAYPEGVCKAVELHEMGHEGGVMRMREVESILVRKREGGRDGRVELKPGGYHIMFMGIEKEYFELGKKVKLKLKFIGAKDILVEGIVKSSLSEKSIVKKKV